MVTDRRQFLLTAKLITETADLKKALKMCETAVMASTAMNAMGDRAQAALETLINKRELGEHVQIAAELALKFNTTMDRQQLDATTIEPLLVDIRSAVFDITAASIVLKHECETA